MKGSHIWILQFVVEICHKFDTSTICNLDKYSQAEVEVAQQCGMNVSQLWAKVGADWDKSILQFEELQSSFRGGSAEVWEDIYQVWAKVGPNFRPF